MNIRLFLCFVFLSVHFSLLSQNSQIDSLQKELKRVIGNQRIFVLNDLAYAYGYIDATKSIYYAKEALLLAEERKYYKAKALSYDILGRAYFISGNNKAADEHYNKCILTAEKYGSTSDIYKALRHKTMVYINGYIRDSSELMSVYRKYIDMTIGLNNFTDFNDGLISFVYIVNNQQQNSLLIREYITELSNRTKNNLEFLSAVYAGEALFSKLNLEYFKAIQKYEQAIKFTKNPMTKASHIERIGNIYFEIRKYEESVLYYRDALKLMNRSVAEPKPFLEYLLEADLGASYLKLKDYNTALTYLHKAVLSPHFSERDRGAMYGNMAVAYISIKRFDQAESYLSKAFLVFDQLSEESDKLSWFNSKAELIILRNQRSQLPVVIEKISKLVNEVDEYYVLFDSYEILSNYFEKIGNYKKSNEYLKRWIIVNDSINNREFASKIKEFDYKYESGKKDQQISLQQFEIKNKSHLLLVSVISVIIIFVAMLIIFVLYSIKNKAYKQLVYRSLESTNNANILNCGVDKFEEDGIENKTENFVIDVELKTKIETSLNEQLNSKIFLESTISLNTLSEKCATNRSYLSQFINEKYKMNFNTFINTLRINEAKQLLSDKENHIPLKELYIRLGFNTYSVFNDAFKKHVGVTPSFYLKTVKTLLDI